MREAITIYVAPTKEFIQMISNLMCGVILILIIIFLGGGRK